VLYDRIVESTKTASLNSAALDDAMVADDEQQVAFAPFAAKPEELDEFIAENAEVERKRAIAQQLLQHQGGGTSIPVVPSVPLPPYWGAFCSGPVHYHNKKTKEATWQPPPADPSMENAHKQPEDKANPDLVNTPVSFAPILDEWSVTAEADTDAFVYTGRVYGEYGMRPGHRRRFTVRASARDTRRSLLS
jgi:hypothetical protein